jgi:ribonuclease R
MTKHAKGCRKMSAANLQLAVLKYLLAKPLKQFTPRQIAGLIKTDNNKDSIEHALRQLEAAGHVTEGKDGKFGLSASTRSQAKPSTKVFLDEEETDDTTTTAPDNFSEQYTLLPPKQASKLRARSTDRAAAGGKQIEGTVDMTRTGAAYIVSDAQDGDVYVNARNLNGALHGDLVRISLFPTRQRRSEPKRRPEGEVTKIVRRANEFFIGTLRLSRKMGIFLPDNPLMPVDLLVPLDAIGEGRDGDKVVVRITNWNEGTPRAPEAKVTQVLGEVGGHDFEMKKILINAGFELSHSDEALAEAAAIPNTISPQEIERRRDFREVLTFTIDPEDAKDFDDALSIRQLENGHYEVGVHIADVTHYLKPDSPLDREAFKRSTSVYLVDRCLPMLPEKLSNNLCSLVPHEDRLTFSAVFEFDAKDKIVKKWFGRTVIHSDQRFSYEAAQTILEDKPTEALTALPLFEQLKWGLKHLQRMARTMRKEREKNGAIGFETEEVRFQLDENGTPIAAYVKERKEAHLLIEDFMLLANKEVALYIDQLGNDKQQIPFVYRIHDQPDMERVAEFSRFAHEMGYSLKVDTPKQIARSFNDLMKAARTDERLKLLEPLAIRTMAKAVYSTQNIGHYGLGFTHYTHFTSPIRRYSDVLAHRILERNLDGRVFRTDVSALEEKCKHVSQQERKAADAERESVKYKQAELVSKHIGEEFEGTISGMVDRGIFVMLDHSQAEGMVEFRHLADTYVLEEGRLRAKGRRYGKVFKLGDRVKVKIIAVHLMKRQIEMEMNAEYE